MSTLRDVKKPLAYKFACYLKFFTCKHDNYSNMSIATKSKNRNKSPYDFNNHETLGFLLISEKIEKIVV